MHSLDLSVFYSIYNLSGHNVWVDRLIIFLGEYLLYIIFAVLLYFIYDSYQKGRVREVYECGVAIIAALTARFGVTEIIRHFYHRPRPFLALHIPHLLTDSSYSFPSGHTIFLFALATVILFVNKRFGYFLYVSGLVIGIARVAAGVHYPSDIIGGIILGTITGLIVYKTWSTIARHS